MSSGDHDPYSSMKHIKTEHHNDLDAFANRNESKSSLISEAHSGGTWKRSTLRAPAENDGQELAVLGVSKYHPNEQNSAVRRRQVRHAEPDTEMTHGPGESWPPINGKVSVQPLSINANSSNKTAGANDPGQAVLDRTSWPINNINKFEILQRLGVEIEILRQDHSARLRKVRELEARIADGEVECGRMIQTYLKLGRAIETRKKHVYEDKRELSGELSCKDNVTKRMDQMITQMNSLVFEMNNHSKPGGSAFEITKGNDEM